MTEIIFKKNKKGGGLFNFIFPDALKQITTENKNKHGTITGSGGKSIDRLFKATESHILDKRRRN